jgi:hypothetical protein
MTIIRAKKTPRGYRCLLGAGKSLGGQRKLPELWLLKEAAVMNHNPEDVIARLVEENERLRTMLIEVLRTIKEVELALSMALDRDRL